MPVGRSIAASCLTVEAMPSARHNGPSIVRPVRWLGVQVFDVIRIRGRSPFLGLDAMTAGMSIRGGSTAAEIRNASSADRGIFRGNLLPFPADDDYIVVAEGADVFNTFATGAKEARLLLRIYCGMIL